MRENRTHGSEGGEPGSTGLPYPYGKRLGLRPAGEAALSRPTIVNAIAGSKEPCGCLNPVAWALLPKKVRDGDGQEWPSYVLFVLFMFFCQSSNS